MSRLRPVSIIAALLLAVALAGCQDASQPPEPPPSAPADPAAASPAYTEAAEPGPLAGCLEDGDTVLEFADSPLPTHALTFGEGSNAVILAHQAGQRPCAWEGFGRTLAEQGYRVFIPTLIAPEATMGAAVAWLADAGVTQYAFVGASMGGTFSLVATPALDPAPRLIVALSSPAVYGEFDALAVIGGLDVPVLLMVGDRDGDFPADARALADAQPAADLLVVESSAHGILLLESDAEVASRLAASLADALG